MNKFELIVNNEGETHVTINGVKVQNITEITFEQKANKPAEINLKLFLK